MLFDPLASFSPKSVVDMDATPTPKPLVEKSNSEHSEASFLSSCQQRKQLTKEVKLRSASPMRAAGNRGSSSSTNPRKGAVRATRRKVATRDLDLPELGHIAEAVKKVLGEGKPRGIKPLKHTQGSLFNLSSSIRRPDTESVTTYLSFPHS